MLTMLYSSPLLRKVGESWWSSKRGFEVIKSVAGIGSHSVHPRCDIRLRHCIYYDMQLKELTIYYDIMMFTCMSTPREIPTEARAPNIPLR